METIEPTPTPPVPRGKPPGREQLPDVRDYTDYRKYLEDFLAAKRASRRGFSVRSFCLKAGISTENYLLRIIRGQRNLGPRMAERFLSAIPLKGAEANYFLRLVHLGSASTQAEKQRCLDDLAKLGARRGKVNAIIDNTMIRHWYTGAIWELASCKDLTLTPQGAVQALQRRISVQQAKEAIEFLLAKGYLVEKDGRLTPDQTPVNSTDGKQDPIVRWNHRETLKIAVEAVDLPIEERGFYGLTLAFNEKRLPEVKERLKAFMNELQAELALDPEANVVYRLHAHCIPLTAAAGTPAASPVSRPSSVPE